MAISDIYIYILQLLCMAISDIYIYIYIYFILLCMAISDIYIYIYFIMPHIHTPEDKWAILLTQLKEMSVLEISLWIH